MTTETIRSEEEKARDLLEVAKITAEALVHTAKSESMRLLVAVKEDARAIVCTAKIVAEKLIETAATASVDVLHVAEGVAAETVEEAKTVLAIHTADVIINRNQEFIKKQTARLG